MFVWPNLKVHAIGIHDLSKSDVHLAGLKKFKVVRNAVVRVSIGFEITLKSSIVQSPALWNQIRVSHMVLRETK